MAEDIGNLYEAIEVPPTASEDEIRQAISTSRRKWQGKQNVPNLAKQQIAARMMETIAEAERTLLDPEARARYDATLRGGAGAPSDGPPRIIIPAQGAQTSMRLDLMRIINVGAPPTGPLVPMINPDKSPMLMEGENFLQHLSGEGACLYQPWPAAPSEHVSPMHGNTTFYFTDTRLVYICPNFVEAGQGKFYGENASSLVGIGASFAATAVSQARANAQAARAVMGRALGGQIPWEYVFCVGLVPGANLQLAGALLSFSVAAGEAEYTLLLHMWGADLGWARQQAEWVVQVALQHRLQLLGEDIMPSERELIEKTISAPKPQYGSDGSLDYYLPVALDGGHALTLV